MEELQAFEKAKQLQQNQLKVAHQARVGFETTLIGVPVANNPMFMLAADNEESLKLEKHKQARVVAEAKLRDLIAEKTKPEVVEEFLASVSESQNVLKADFVELKKIADEYRYSEAPEPHDERTEIEKMYGLSKSRRDQPIVDERMLRQKKVQEVSMAHIPYLHQDKVPESDGLDALVPFRQEKYYREDPVTVLGDVKGEESIHKTGL